MLNKKEENEIEYMLKEIYNLKDIPPDTVMVEELKSNSKPDSSKPELKVMSSH